MNKARLFQDDIHGFVAESLTMNGAWQLIRSICKELRLRVPTMLQIKEIQ